MDSALSCQDCGASLHLAEGQKTVTCFFCRSSAVVERPSDPDRPRPAFALGFVVTPEGAREVVRRWQKNLGPFRDAKIRKASVEAIVGVYLPAYLYSAATYSDYRCRAGSDFTTGAGDTLQNHTAWHPVQGRQAAYVRDVFVPASRGIRRDELGGVEPYDLRALHRYTPALISGWAAEDPTLTTADCWVQARAEADRHVRAQLGAFLPGDRQEKIERSTRLTHESLDTVLLPVWVLAIRREAHHPPVRILVNGQTGRLHAHAEFDWIRWLMIVGGVVVLVLSLLALLTLIAFVVSR